MASQLIGTTETGWFNPGVNPPPFDMKLLLMVAGSRSEDCGRTFEPYTVVMTAYVQQQGPGDEYDDEPAFDEYMSGDQSDFLEFQFNLKDEDGEVLDWYSDSIVAWAYYPLGIAQTAVNVERERQAALVPNVQIEPTPLAAVGSNAGCDYQGHEFGATYPDSLCIDGYLWDADSGDTDGDGWCYTNGGEIPCPKCNAVAYQEYCADQVQEVPN